MPYVFYSYYLETEFRKRGIRTLNDYWDAHEAEDTSDLIQGTVIVGANSVSAGKDLGLDPLRSLEPTERYGNLLIYRGAFRLPKQRAWRLYLRGLKALYSVSDVHKAERLFAEALEWNPKSFCTAIEVANLRAKRGARAEAIETFEIALHSASEQAIRDAIARQISLLKVQDPRAITPLGDPCLE